MTCKCGAETGRHGHASDAQCWRHMAARIATLADLETIATARLRLLEARVMTLEQQPHGVVGLDGKVHFPPVAVYQITDRYSVIHDDSGPDTDDGCEPGEAGQ